MSDHGGQGLSDILRVGTSAGGARAKAVIAWHPQTGDVRSGQLDVESGYQHWLLKFDGVSANRDKELDDSQGFGQIESDAAAWPAVGSDRAVVPPHGV